MCFQPDSVFVDSPLSGLGVEQARTLIIIIIISSSSLVYIILCVCIVIICRILMYIVSYSYSC